MYGGAVSGDSTQQDSQQADKDKGIGTQSVKQKAGFVDAVKADHADAISNTIPAVQAATTDNTVEPTPVAEQLNAGASIPGSPKPTSAHRRRRGGKKRRNAITQPTATNRDDMVNSSNDSRQLEHAAVQSAASGSSDRARSSGDCVKPKHKKGKDNKGRTSQQSKSNVEHETKSMVDVTGEHDILHSAKLVLKALMSAELTTNHSIFLAHSHVMLADLCLLLCIIVGMRHQVTNCGLCHHNFCLLTS